MIKGLNINSSAIKQCSNCLASCMPGVYWECRYCEIVSCFDCLLPTRIYRKCAQTYCEPCTLTYLSKTSNFDFLEGQDAIESYLESCEECKQTFLCRRVWWCEICEASFCILCKVPKTYKKKGDKSFCSGCFLDASLDQKDLDEPESESYSLEEDINEFLKESSQSEKSITYPTKSEGSISCSDD